MYKPKRRLIILILCGLTLVLLNPVYGFDCSYLDPRHEVLQEIDTDIQGTAEALFRLGRLDGELSNRVRDEVRNMHMNHPDAKTIDLNNRLIYFFCIMLKDADQLTDAEKLDRFKDFCDKIMKVSDKVSDTKQIQVTEDQSRRIQSG